MPTVKEQKSGITSLIYGVNTTDDKVALAFSFRNLGYYNRNTKYSKAGLFVKLSVGGFTAQDREEHENLRAALGKLRSVDSFDVRLVIDY